MRNTYSFTDAEQKAIVNDLTGMFNLVVAARRKKFTHDLDFSQRPRQEVLRDVLMQIAAITDFHAGTDLVMKSVSLWPHSAELSAIQFIHYLDRMKEDEARQAISVMYRAMEDMAREHDVSFRPTYNKPK